MGWDSSEKRKELFHTDSRFIILSIAGPHEGHIVAEESNTIIGFSMFRFDYEEGEKLLYWSVRHIRRETLF